MSMPDSRWLKEITKAPSTVMLGLSIGCWVGWGFSPAEPEWMRPIFATFAVTFAAIPLLKFARFVFLDACLPALAWCRNFPRRLAELRRSEGTRVQKESLDCLRTVLAYDHFDEYKMTLVVGERYEPPETPPTTEELSIAMEKLNAMGLVPFERESRGDFARRLIPLVAAHGVRGAKRRSAGRHPRR